MTDLLTCLQFSLRVEAGFQADPNDPGNYAGGQVSAGPLIGTNRGISAPVLIAWRAPRTVTRADMEALSQDEAVAIYGAKFWNPIQGDRLPPGVNLSTLDHEINSGHGGAICLQRAIGATDDGWIGQGTLAALASVDPGHVASGLTPKAAVLLQTALGVSPDGHVGPLTVVALCTSPRPVALAVAAALYDRQVAYYQSLPGWGRYGASWAARTRDRCVAACSMARRAA